jgi:hypothetical protein
MREVRQTFEHLVIIFGILLLCLIMIFAIPGIRVWAFENIPSAVVGVAGNGSVSHMMVGVDPQLLAAAVNDDGLREDLITLWKESLAEMEPDAMAKVFNDYFADPNTGAKILDLVAELEPAAASGFLNTVLSDPVTSTYLRNVLPLVDQEGLSNLINEVVGAEQTANTTVRVLDGLDSGALVDFMADIVASEEGTRLVSDLAVGLLEGDNQEATRQLLFEVTDSLGVADLFASVLLHNGGQLDDFLQGFFSNESFRHMVSDALAEAGPEGAVHQLFEDIQEGLFGDPEAPEVKAFLDYLWVGVNVKQIDTHGYVWDDEGIEEIISHYVPEGSYLEPLAEMVTEIIRQIMGDMMGDFNVWVNVTGVRFQDEPPYEVSGS